MGENGENGLRNATTGNVNLVVVGSIGIDTIETKRERRESILGGSASYACAAASFFSSVGMVGIVGDDFPEEHMQLYKGFGIDLEGLQKAQGETFRWSGVYEDDMDNRRTLSTELNVFESFTPELPATYKAAPYFLLGNISPELQLHVLSKVEGAGFVVADTMDLWINTARDPLMELIGKVDMLTVNESETRLLTGEEDLEQAARIILEWGPKYVIVKKGGDGALLVSKENICAVPAFPVDEVLDPTGAGHSFAGGLMGVLARIGEVNDDALLSGLYHGSVVASFGVERFSLEGLESLDMTAIKARLGDLRGMGS